MCSYAIGYRSKFFVVTRCKTPRRHKEKALELHAELHGKLEIKSRVSLKDKEDLALAYTPGVAQPCLEIQKDPSKSYKLTRRWNTVAVVTDRTAVLGLSGICPEAGMPVMEDLKVVQNGPGAAGTAIIKMLLGLGIKDIVAVDSKGIIYPERWYNGAEKGFGSDHQSPASHRRSESRRGGRPASPVV